MAKDFFSKEKKIYDPVHGFILFDEEREVIGSVPFQRLHYIHQLGIAYLVYPGATHSRFEHSLGTMELCSRIFHNICKTARPDVFHLVPRIGSLAYGYWRLVLRLAALCHDLGHLPFSHVAEKEVLGEEGHEHMTLKIIESSYLAPILRKIFATSPFTNEFSSRDFLQDVSKIAIGEKKWVILKKVPFTPWERVVAAVLTGDFFGGDRIDYLLRDAKSTGVAYGLFDYEQLIEMIRVLPTAGGKKEELALGINENGLESCEALLLARHFMHRRVYQYSSVKAYSFHLRRFIKKIYPLHTWEKIKDFLQLNDAVVICELHKAASDPCHIGYEDARRIVYRKDRFRALSIPSSVTDRDLKDIQQKIKAPQGEFDWELKKNPFSDESLSFPVSRSHLMVEQAKDCSELLCKVAGTTQSWIYVSSNYEVDVTSALENYKKL